ncbi:SdiA-regulated domain-containing protein [Gemmobacter sp.]|uniref:SdiA-regulated domain-containing protein n=1 Tax=Gemmobacter sp. TaxID=1898957 RepID=UPI002B000A69|nr:SdiA-regulated domain-containing protein [Gemmobacter sp.]
MRLALLPLVVGALALTGAAFGPAAMPLLSWPFVPEGGGLLARGHVADIPGHPVAGVADNLSGLTWSSASGTLFSVTNRPPRVVELTQAGAMLRVLPLEGFADPEGITHVAGDIFLIADERDQRLHRVTIAPDTARVASDAVIDTGIGAWHNMGIEGISWDEAHNRLFLAQEMLPMRVMVLDGFDAAARPLAGTPPVADWHPASLSSLMTLDLSSLTVDAATGHVLLLSHLSAAVVEYDAAGRLLGRMGLGAGQSGLPAAIAQAEGVATAPDGRLFLVAEPNLFYRFAPAR